MEGGDSQFVDYMQIDSNEYLDDYWLEEQGQDAEDAYFDED
jgi:hypothetical protein